jgi:hypothetical protein
MSLSKIMSLFLAGFALVEMLASSQTPPSSLPPRVLPKIILPTSEGGTRTLLHSPDFYIGGKQYRSTLDLSVDKSNSEWAPSSPLPIALTTAEEIARAELRKLVDGESKWQVTDFQISRSGPGANWYLAVTLEPEVQVVAETLPPDSFTALLDFSGKPGRIRQVSR